MRLIMVAAQVHVKQRFSGRPPPPTNNRRKCCVIVAPTLLQPQQRTTHFWVEQPWLTVTADDEAPTSTSKATTRDDHWLIWTNYVLPRLVVTWFNDNIAQGSVASDSRDIWFRTVVWAHGCYRSHQIVSMKVVMGMRWDGVWLLLKGYQPL